jgi:hypothetical protein
MRYELDDRGYICKVFFGCFSGTCTLYEGEVPTGYTTLEEWATTANIRAYKIEDGNLILDTERDAELQSEWQTLNGKSLLFNGVASVGDTITLNDDYRKYSLLHIVTGSNTEDYRSALVGSTLDIGEEIEAGKIFSNNVGQIQIHSAVFATMGPNTLVLKSAYFQRTASGGNGSLGDANECKVRRIYGSI